MILNTISTPLDQESHIIKIRDPLIKESGNTSSHLMLLTGSAGLTDL